jgi:hypothetical protein
MPTTIQVTTSLPIHIPRGFDHQPLDGGQLGDSPRGNSLRGDPWMVLHRFVISFARYLANIERFV